jgi:hypothetical protein
MLVAVLAVRSAAQDKPAPPSTLPPQIVVAQATEKDGGVIVKFSTPQFRQIARTITVETNGEKVNHLVTQTEFAQWVNVELPIDGKEVKAFGADGKAIEPKELTKRLEKPTQVAVVFGHPALEAKLDPYYLRVLREDIVVFTGPGTKFFPPAPPPKK